MVLFTNILYIYREREREKGALNVELYIPLKNEGYHICCFIVEITVNHAGSSCAEHKAPANLIGIHIADFFDLILLLMFDLL